MKKIALGAVAIWFGMLEFGVVGCNLGGSESGNDAVWLTGDLPDESAANTGDVGAEEVGDDVTWVEDVGLDLATPNAEIAAEVDSETPCLPDCAGKVCGPDGCGATCGSCINENACNEASGQCMEDPPNCADKECGPDGVGGLCGVCQEPASCNDDGKCVSAPPECAYCVEPYPSCVQIANVWSCVECFDDTGCPEGAYCDLTYYSCKIPPPEGAGLCDAETACMESDTITFGLACDTDNGLCFDQFGWCDDAYARCRPGSQCLILQSIPNALIGPDPAIYPPGGGPGTVGLCSCQNPMDVTQLMNCLANPANPCPPSLECPGAQQCAATSAIASMVPLPTSAPGVCVDVTKMLTGM